jgi:hypothetical protein
MAYSCEQLYEFNDVKEQSFNADIDWLAKTGAHRDNELKKISYESVAQLVEHFLVALAKDVEKHYIFKNWPSDYALKQELLYKLNLLEKKEAKEFRDYLTYKTAIDWLNDTNVYNFSVHDFLLVFNVLMEKRTKDSEELTQEAFIEQLLKNPKRIKNLKSEVSEEKIQKHRQERIKRQYAFEAIENYLNR